MRHIHADEVSRLIKRVLLISNDFTDVAAKIVAQSANDDVAFLIDQERRFAVFCRIGDSSPDGGLVVEVPLQFFCRTTNSGCTNNGAHAVRHGHILHGGFELGSIFTFNATRNATGTRVVRHQDEESPGQADKGCQGSTFVAALFLFDLNNDLLTFFDTVADIWPATVAFAIISLQVFTGNFLEGKKAVSLCAIINKRRFEAWLDAGDFGFVNI